MFFVPFHQNVWDAFKLKGQTLKFTIMKIWLLWNSLVPSPSIPHLSKVLYYPRHLPGEWAWNLMKFALDGDCTKYNLGNKNQRDWPSINSKRALHFNTGKTKSKHNFSWAKIEVIEAGVYFIYLWDQAGMVWDGGRWLPRWLLQISLHFCCLHYWWQK